jgi:undecaprenyl-diphosphatase
MVTLQRSEPRYRGSGITRNVLLNSVIVSMLIGAMTLSFFAAGPGTLPGDIVVTRSIQHIAFGPLESLVTLMNWLGSTRHVVAIGGAIALSLLAFRRARQAQFLTIALSLAGISIPLLKWAFASPRPTSVDVTVNTVISGWGFPSGHVIGATLLYGTLWYLLVRSSTARPVRLAVHLIALLMIGLSGFSRIYVGAHWPSDVLGGYLWGGLLLIAVIGMAESRCFGYAG